MVVTDWKKDVFSAFPAGRQYLIPLLQAIQDNIGYLSKESIYMLSDYLSLPESKIYGVATFYNQFKLRAPGKYNIQICRGTACHVKGSFDLLETLKTELDIEEGETTKDGLFSLEQVACLGACSIAPVIMINGEFHGRLDKKKLTGLLDGIKKEEGE